MRKRVSTDSGVCLSRSCQPTCSPCVTPPPRARMVLIPAKPRGSIYDCVTGLMRASRSELHPTPSGDSMEWFTVGLHVCSMQAGNRFHGHYYSPRLSAVKRSSRPTLYRLQIGSLHLETSHYM